ncbi:MAG: radical SAM protein, partial [Candidatus Scalindua sp.]|nr:radical SAM protein [Candidatus Scalindua sp.]
GRCNLGCIFCQNYSISHLGEGREISFETLADIMLDLQNIGCHNINFVTPTHQMPMIMRSLKIAIERGLFLPLVYNCGGYESLESLTLLDGIVDIYMPDFKYFDPESGLKYSHVKDYPEVAKAAIREMHRQVGDLVINDNGIALRGLLLRHLVLPDNMAGSKDIVKFIAEKISKNTYINIMDQYHPCFKAFDDPHLKRRISRNEYSEVINYAITLGLTRIDGINI